MASLVQAIGDTSITEDGDLAFPSDVSEGSRIVVILRDGNGSNSAAITDSLGNTYSQVFGSGGQRPGIWTAISEASGPCTVYWNTTGSGSARVVIAEFDGNWVSPVAELTTTITTGTSSPQTTNTLTRTASDPGLFVSFYDTNGDASAHAVDADFTFAASGGGGRISMAYRVSLGAEAQNCQWSATLTNGNTNGAGLVSFVETSGGSPSNAPRSQFYHLHGMR